MATAWSDGVGPEELDAPGERHALFAALAHLLSGARTEIPSPPDGAPWAVLHAAAVVLDAALGRAPAELERAIAALAQALAALGDEPHAAAARAWADLALGEAALAIGDLGVAWHRFRQLAGAGQPVALRIHALLRTIELALERRDLESARASARKAIALAGSAGRAVQLSRARHALGLLDYAAGDLPAMRETLAGEPLSKLLLATAEAPVRALELLAELIRDAAAAGDPLTYALSVKVAVQRYEAIGLIGEAWAVRERAVVELRNISPILGKLLED